VVLPVLLILLFGYGLSLDVRHVPVAVVLEDASPEARELAAGFQLSPYFDVQLLTSMPRAQELMLARQVDGIVRIRPDFARRLSLGDAEVQILVHGTDANRARIIQSYAQGAVSQWAARQAAEGREVAPGPVVLRERLWFNETNESHYFLVPGLVVLGIGLLISSAVRSQLVASQVTLLVTFMPAVMLSGFLFDLRSMPAPVRLITYALPARYYVTLLQTVFLAGDVWGVLLPNTA